MTSKDVTESGHYHCGLCPEHKSAALAVATASGGDLQLSVGAIQNFGDDRNQ